MIRYVGTEPCMMLNFSPPVVVFTDDLEGDTIHTQHNLVVQLGRASR